MKTIILASGSPRRKELLEKLGIDFVVEPSNFEEDMTQKLDPMELVKKLSLGKARDIASKHSNSIVIGADTLIAYAGEVLGKPHTREKAIDTLEMLNGNNHSVITGFTIIDTDTEKIISKAVETKVYFRNLKKEEIEKYVETNEPLDKAGAYAIQGKGVLLISKIEGDFNNVVGLPLTEVALSLEELGIEIF